MIYKFYESVFNKTDIKTIYDKYYSTIPFDIFKQIIQSDPTSSIGDELYVGKYSKWLLKLYKNNKLNVNELKNVKIDLKIYDALIIRNLINDKSIDNVNDISNLNRIVSPFKPVYQNDYIDIFKPTTFEQVKFYGSKKWCFSYDKKWWEFYSNKNIIIVNIKNQHIVEQLYNDFKDNLNLVKNSEMFHIIDNDDTCFDKIGVCFYDGVEIWNKSNYILNKNQNYNFLKISKLDKIIFNY